MHAEEAVEKIVAAQRENKRSDVTLRVTREHPEETLVGLTVIERNVLVLKHPSFPRDAFTDAALITVIALSESYRGGFTTQDGTPLGRVLLTDALNHIAETSDGKMPPVQAVISPENTPSRRLFESHGFSQPIETSPDLFYLRPRGLPVDPDPPGATIDTDNQEASAGPQG